MIADMHLDINNEKSYIKQIRESCSGTQKPGVSVIVPTVKMRYMSNIFKNYTGSGYPVKELIIVLNANHLELSEYQKRAQGIQNVMIFQKDEKYTLGECLNFAVKKSSYDYIAKMDDDDYYGPNYLEDMMNVFSCTDAELTGKNPVFVYFEDNSSLYLHKSHKPIMGGTLLFKKELFKKVKFKKLNIREDNYFLRDCLMTGIKITASDKYNYVYIRHSNLRDHTFRMPSGMFLETYSIERVLTVKDFVPFVTV